MDSCRKQLQMAGNFLELLESLHENIGAARGEPLNAKVLLLLGDQAVSACCQRLRTWSWVGGRRVCPHLNDVRGPPFVPLERINIALVQVIDLSRDGRESVEERAQVIMGCRRATTLRCLYCSLTGLGTHLDWGDGLAPSLNLRHVRFRDTSLTAFDVVQMLRCTPRLETLILISEQLDGLGDCLEE